MLQNYGQGHVCLLPFLTHFADLSSWEYAKKLKAILPQIEAAGVQVGSANFIQALCTLTLAPNSQFTPCSMTPSRNMMVTDGANTSNQLIVV